MQKRKKLMTSFEFEQLSDCRLKDSSWRSRGSEAARFLSWRSRMRHSQVILDS